MPDPMDEFGFGFYILFLSAFANGMPMATDEDEVALGKPNHRRPRWILLICGNKSNIYSIGSGEL